MTKSGFKDASTEMAGCGQWGERAGTRTDLEALPLTHAPAIQVPRAPEAEKDSCA